MEKWLMTIFLYLKYEDKDQGHLSIGHDGSASVL